jgi:hypothetical protein
VISLVQVVAAMAAGALVAVSFVLVLKVYDLQRRIEPDEDAPPERRPLDQVVERESRIDAAASIAIDLFETIRPEDVHHVQVQESRAEVREMRLLPDHAVAVRSKKHLRLYAGSGIAALISLYTVGRAAMRAQQAQIIGSAVGGVTMVSAVSVLTLTPWTMDGQTEPPAPTPSATWSYTETQSPRDATLAAATTLPKRSASPSSQREMPSPSASPSSTGLVSPTAQPSSAVPTPTLKETPAPAHSDTTAPASEEPAQPGVARPSASHPGPPANPGPPAGPPGQGHRHHGNGGRR